MPEHEDAEPLAEPKPLVEPKPLAEPKPLVELVETAHPVSTSSTSDVGTTSDGRTNTRWLPLLAALALLGHLAALYTPGSPDGALELPWLPGADKVVHLLIFAIPVYLFGRLTRRVGLVAGVFAVHAVVSELVQWRFVPYRDGDPLDALVDLIGIGLAVLLLKRRPGR